MGNEGGEGVPNSFASNNIFIRAKPVEGILWNLRPREFASSDCERSSLWNTNSTLDLPATGFLLVVSETAVVGHGSPRVRSIIRQEAESRNLNFPFRALHPINIAE